MSEAKITARGKIYSLLIRLDRLHWLWLGLAAPFLLFPSSERSLVMLIVPALWLLHWFVVRSAQRISSHQLSLVRIKQRSAFPLTPLNGALLLMALMVLVSLWATFDIGYSLPMISGMVLGIGVFFAVAREGERPIGWILSLVAFLGVGLGFAAVGVFGTRWFSFKITLFDPIISHLPKLPTELQGGELSFHPNIVAGALIWVLPLMIAISVAMILLPRAAKIENAIILRKRWLEKMRGWWIGGVTTLCLVATFFVAGIFLLTQSRAGFISLALTLLAMVLIILPPRWCWISLALMALFAIVLGILLATQLESVIIWVKGSNLAADPGLSLDTFEGRLEVWSRAIYGIQDFPFTGMGMNGFRKVMPVLYPLFLISPDIDIGHAHNEFLQAALDLGIPGLIAFLALYIGAFWMLADIWRATRHASLNVEHWSHPIRFLTLGLGGGMLAHLLYGLTDTVALGSKPGVLFWMLLGLISGLHWQARGFGDVKNARIPTTDGEIDPANN